MIYLVTGCAGFIGYNTCKRLLEGGNSIVGIDNLNDYYNPIIKKKRLSILKKNKNFEFIKLDVSKYKDLTNKLAGKEIDLIIHLAAQAGVRYSIGNPWIYENSNSIGTLNIFEYAKEKKISKIVYASSSSVYGGVNEEWVETANLGTPVSMYAATKLHNEQTAYVYYKLQGIKSIGLRFFTVYGEYGRPDMSLWLFTKNILNNKPIDVYNHGDMRRDFTYVSDIVEGIISATNYDCDYEIFNLSANNTVELEYVISLIENELGIKATKNYMPMQKGDVQETRGNIEKARNLLGYNPKVNIEQGIKNFVSWFKKNKKLTNKL
ncbi:MAG: GDP-mannose 4,6-dehydratase [Candidatus ainarchaeum sp.]|nr:GDP-mannose 4,6-dehydratase [Candidatus Izemoplasmatales bacterium]MDD3976362.1 GDP-mannose 4,6-dehydratase [Candidatus ainarchaeum sp.]